MIPIVTILVSKQNNTHVDTLALKYIQFIVLQCISIVAPEHRLYNSRFSYLAQHLKKLNLSNFEGLTILF